MFGKPNEKILAERQAEATRRAEAARREIITKKRANPGARGGPGLRILTTAVPLIEKGLLAQPTAQALEDALLALDTAIDKKNNINKDTKTKILKSMSDINSKINILKGKIGPIIKSKLDEIEVLKKQNNDLQAAYKKQNTLFEESKVLLTKQINENSELKEENVELKKELSVINNNINRLTKENNTLGEEKKNFSKELENLKNTYDAIYKEYETNKTKLNDQEKIIAKMTTEIVEMNAVKNELEANYKQITDYINGLNAKIQSILIVTNGEIDTIIADINTNIAAIYTDLTSNVGPGTANINTLTRRALQNLNPNPSAGYLSGVIKPNGQVNKSFFSNKGGNKTKKGGWKYNKLSSSYRRSSSRRIYTSKKNAGKSSRGTIRRSK